MIGHAVEMLIMMRGFFKGTMISKNGYEHTSKIDNTEQGYSITDDAIGDCDIVSFFPHTLRCQNNCNRV